MANVNTIYARLTNKVLSTANSETDFLAGTAATDYNGSPVINANTLSKGSIIRLHAWGTWTNTNSSGNQFVRVKVKVGTTVIGDTGNNGSALAGSTTDAEWHFFAQITIQADGANGTGVCDSYLENVESAKLWPNVPFSKMAGLGTSFNINTTQNNTLSLTVTLTAANTSFSLFQCSIEHLPTP